MGSLQIDQSKFEQIDKIFREKIVFNKIETACIPWYNDILIFKKKGEIVGIAKINFDCGTNIIIGTNANTENFGQEGDYEKLKELLKK